MKRKISVGIILLLLTLFVDGLFSFINNPKLEQELLNELTVLVNEEFNKTEYFENTVLGESTVNIVARVVDADTIELSSKQKVRYIGINAPETKHPTKEVECFGKVASLKNKELTEGKEIRLEKDISETDRYGRLLRYVYVIRDNEEIFINEYLVREGYAKASSYPPDIKYQELFKQAENEARELNKGLWGKGCG